MSTVRSVTLVRSSFDPWLSAWQTVSSAAWHEQMLQLYPVERCQKKKCSMASTPQGSFKKKIQLNMRSPRCSGWQNMRKLYKRACWQLSQLLTWKLESNCSESDEEEMCYCWWLSLAETTKHFQRFQRCFLLGQGLVRVKVLKIMTESC
jgi:hypothetical protein